jgi:nucleoside-diphosphate-sugar epimerase
MPKAETSGRQPLQPQRILITGARGFLGRAVYAQARKAFPDAEIVAVGRKPPRHPLDPPGPVCDLTQKSAWLSLGNAFDVIYHIAATLPIKGHPVLDNIIMADCLYEACERWRPSFLAYASTISVYPVGEVDTLTEDVAPKPDSSYGIAKLGGEHYCRLAGRFCDHTAVLRFASIYGPGKRPDFNTVMDIFIAKVSSNQPPTVFGTGARTQDFVYVTDAARAFIDATAACASGVFNIGSGVATSMYDLATTIIEVFDIASMSPQLISGRQEDTSVKLSIERAKAILGYCPQVSLKEGIQRLLKS